MWSAFEYWCSYVCVTTMILTTGIARTLGQWTSAHIAYVSVAAALLLLVVGHGRFGRRKQLRLMGSVAIKLSTGLAAVWLMTR